MTSTVTKKEDIRPDVDSEEECPSDLDEELVDLRLQEASINVSDFPTLTIKKKLALLKIINCPENSDSENENEPDVILEEEETDKVDKPKKLTLGDFFDTTGPKKSVKAFSYIKNDTQQSYKNSTQFIARMMLRNYNEWYHLWRSLEKTDLCHEIDTVEKKDTQITVQKSNNVTNNEESHLNNEEKLSRNLELKETVVNAANGSELETENIKRNSVRMVHTLPRENTNHRNYLPSPTSIPDVEIRQKSPYSSPWFSTTLPRSSQNGVQNRWPAGKVQKESPKKEAKVQCPICQLDFLQSKVETHAALCEGYPIETRSTKVVPSKNIPSNSTFDYSSSPEKYDTTEASYSRALNKKRELTESDEDEVTAKRACLER